MPSKTLSALCVSIGLLTDFFLIFFCRYFFDNDGGKKIRPTMVLAISYALNSQGNKATEKLLPESKLGPILSVHNTDVEPFLYATPQQKRLAEITEMIHTASLFHDDVIDKATTRRNVSAVNQVFGNKLAILGGDFLLSRASVSLARLRNFEVSVKKKTQKTYF